jgi:hypothetical protein
VRVADLLTSFDRDVQIGITAVEQRADEAQTALLAVQRDPIERLDSIELTRANGLASFVREDYETLPLDTLVDRARAALAAGRKPEMALAARYAGRRVEAERQRHPASRIGETGVDAGGQHPEQGALRALADTVAALVAALTPADLAKKAAAAEQAQRNVRALRLLAGKTRAQLDGSAARAEADLRARLHAAL